MQEYTARAHTNIALLKYWGKADTKLIIPTTSSISLTLDEFYTDTTVKFDETLQRDQVYLNGQALTGKSYDKIVQFLNLVRERANVHDFAQVRSINHVPTAAGLASSASAFAALAGSASYAAGLTLNQTELSQLARRGSGSACRSIFGGFVEWQRGDCDANSYAKVLESDVNWDIQLLTVIVNDQPKKIDSRGGMQHTKATSPFYEQWVNNTNQAVSTMENAIANQDFTRLGALAEQNALQMHATNATANPPFNYLTDASWQVIQLAAQLRQQGIEVYATMDAGPNVKLISKTADTKQIMQDLNELMPGVQTVVATPGPGIQIVKGDTI